MPSVRHLLGRGALIAAFVALVACSAGPVATPELASTHAGKAEPEDGREPPLSNEDFDYEAHIEALRKASGIQDPPGDESRPGYRS